MLSKLLYDMLYEAKAKPNQPIRRKLHQGLHIQLLHDGSALLLSLARERVYPSHEEWVAILRAFPYLVPYTLEPRRSLLHGRPSLSAVLPEPGAEQTKFWG